MKVLKKQGFTLIELMLVVAIIGLLASIAVPSFVSYRQRSYDKRAGSVLKNIASAQSAYNAKNDRYTSVSANITSLDPNIPTSSATGIVWGINSATATGFNVTVSHALGSGITYTADQSALMMIY